MYLECQYFSFNQSTIVLTQGEILDKVICVSLHIMLS